MKSRRDFTPIIITFIIIVVEIAISFNSVLLPNIKLDLAISDQIAQSTISIGLFALGGSGIIYGGLADSVGRRPMLICSISIFFISTFAITFATTIEVFLMGKFAQGLGSGAAWVVGNACLKDIKYLQILRDEVHNFAIKNHRAKRSNAISTSSLDNIPGIGATRKKALLNYFGSFSVISEATISELIKAEGISKSTAKIIYEYLH